MRTYALSGCKRSVLIIFTSIWAVRSFHVALSVHSKFILTSLVFPQQSYWSLSSSGVQFVWFIFLRPQSLVFKPMFADELPPPGIPGCFLSAANKAEVVLPFVVVLLNDTGPDLLSFITLRIELVRTAIVPYTLYLGIRNYRHARTPLVVTLYRDGPTTCFYAVSPSLIKIFDFFSTNVISHILVECFHASGRHDPSEESTRTTLQHVCLFPNACSLLSANCRIPGFSASCIVFFQRGSSFTSVTLSKRTLNQNMLLYRRYDSIMGIWE
jgi:hypothetical protein